MCGGKISQFNFKKKMKNQKPDYKKIHFNPDAYWGKALMATFILDLDKFDESQKIVWDKFKAAYEKFMNKGQIFMPDGDSKADAICEIWRIDFEKQVVYWRQTKDSVEKARDEYRMTELKGAKGNWDINYMLCLLHMGQIKFIEQ